MNYDDFFSQATGIAKGPFDYQHGLANDAWPDLLDVPTGLGKTAAVTLAWAYKRSILKDSDTPRRLVWCLPMRVLVEQTKASIEGWLRRMDLLGNAGEGKISVHVLMGGEADMSSWAEHPQENMVLIGTQDMLLSRALMRGYGMSRYQWPVHFGLLHSDTLWVYDEVQLMGVGLQTSAQLEALRRVHALGRGSRSLWVSATLNRDWLLTVDMRPHGASLVTRRLSEAERQHAEVRKRIHAVKQLMCARTALTKENSKNKAAAYVRALADEVLEVHRPGTQTVVILNTVQRAQALFHALKAKNTGCALLLVHSRFRQAERAAINEALGQVPATDGPGRIVIATQAIEAGVDISAKAMFTELAPWSSLVQRFGRCNRYGEWNEQGGAEIRWIDIEAEQSSPYQKQEIEDARSTLDGMTSASPADLPAVDQPAPIVPLLRRPDLYDLFNTDPDLSGFDTDISPYIRDGDDMDAQVFWRDIENGVRDQLAPDREEVCRVSLGQLRAYFGVKQRKEGRAAWVWDDLDEQWKPFKGDRIRPGLTLMLDTRYGGYDGQAGFIAELVKQPVQAIAPLRNEAMPAFASDRWSTGKQWVGLPQHLIDAHREMENLLDQLDITGPVRPVLLKSAAWHDVGKGHEVFLKTMTRCAPERADGRLWAKSPCWGKHGRPYFRHELASALCWLLNNGKDPDVDRIAYLIAAHHGKVRMSLRSMPGERQPEGNHRRYARGVWDGDDLPEVATPVGVAPATRLRLDLMEIGEGGMGPSWADRTQRLLEEYGPFQLAWWEALLRIADRRGSAIVHPETFEQHE